MNNYINGRITCHTAILIEKDVDQSHDNCHIFSVMFLRRLGPDPHLNGASTPALMNCPDVFELTDRDFAVIGIDITEEAKPLLPKSASCGPDERIVRLPRRILVHAKKDIPDTL